MEGSKSSRTDLKQVPHVRVKLTPSKKLIKKSSKPETSLQIKLNFLKTKVFYDQMKKMQLSPKINKISKEIVNSSRTQKEPKSNYIRRILSNKVIPKSISSQSTLSYASACSSPKFAVLADNSFRISASRFNQQSPTQEKTVKNQRDLKNSNIFTRSVEKIRIREESLEKQRQQKYYEGLRECTFTPQLNRKGSKIERSRSAKSCKTDESSFIREKTPVSMYKSLSPSPVRYGFKSGANLAIVREKGTGMFKYLALKMSYL